MARARRGELTTAVLTYVQEHAGQRVKLDELVNATGYSEGQIQQSMNRIRVDGKWPLVAIHPGRIWRIGETDYVRVPARILNPGEVAEEPTAPTAPTPSSLVEPASPAPRTIVSDKPYVPMGWQRDPSATGWRLVPESVMTEPAPSSERLLPPQAEPATEPGPATEPEPGIQQEPKRTRRDLLNDPANFLYEEVGNRTDGRLIIRGEDGAFYLATLEKI